MLASLWPVYGADGVRRVTEWIMQDADNRHTDYARNAFAFVRDQVDPGPRRVLDGLMSEPHGNPDEPQADHSVSSSSEWIGSGASISSALVMRFPEPPPPPSWRSMSPAELRSALAAQRQIDDVVILHEVFRLPDALVGDEVRALVRRHVDGVPAPEPYPEVSAEPLSYDEESLRAEREALLRGDFGSINPWSLWEITARHGVGMTPEVCHRVISAARGHPDPEVFVGAVAGLARSLPVRERQPLFREAMQRALTVDEPGTPGSQRVAALRCIAEVLDDGMVSEAIEAAEVIDWPRIAISCKPNSSGVSPPQCALTMWPDC